MIFIRFIFGLLLGSFLNVVALRYREDKFVFNPEVIGGRSHCRHCKKKLRWFELFPVVSFSIQGGKCRNCGKKISWIYPIGEILSGLVLALTPLRLPGAAGWVWVLVFELFLLLSLIDFRLRLIPDELTIFLGILGIISLGFNLTTDFTGAYRFLFGFQDNVWLNHILGAVALSLFFYAITVFTRGKGMGLGDVKLAVALGLLFGWPGGFIMSALSFVLGGIVGLALILLGKKTRKSVLSFGPFLALGAFVFFMWGEKILSFYFNYLLNWSSRIWG
jgi:prepilin signal peptidase PulO-like enzyme (type II secretory pathway)